MKILMTLIIFILSSLGLAFTCWGAYHIFFEAEGGIVFRVVLFCIGVVPGAIISIGFLMAAIMDVLSPISDKKPNEKP